MNELMTTSVTLKLGTIELDNKKQLNQMLDDLLKKYTNTVVTTETEKESKKQRTELNNVIKSLSSFRIEKKKAYLEPLEAFENDMKDLTAKVNEVKEVIDSGLKELDEQKRQERAERAEELLAEYGKGFEIIFKPSWLTNAAKEAHIIEDIKDQVREFEVLAKQRTEAIGTIREICESNGLTPEGYIQLLESGAGDLLQIIKSINDAAQAKREREAKEKELALIAEQKKQQEADYNSEIARLEAEKQNEQPEPLPEPTKEEVIAESKVDNPEPFETGELLTSVLELKGTLTQFTALKSALVASGVQIRELATEEDYLEILFDTFGRESN